MSLKNIQIKGVRNIEEIQFQPTSGVNIIVGPNGSGKTSLLESLYILSRARSFRTQNIAKVLSHNAESLIVFAEIDILGSTNKLAIKKNHEKTFIRVNGKTESKSSELSRLLHTHLIRPESQTLLENGSAPRRSFIDMGVFHVKHSFLKISKQYNQLLKQRNRLLKTKQLDTLAVWSNKLIEYGTMVTEARQGYIAQLEQELKTIVSFFIVNIDVEIQYLKGWEKNSSLSEALTRSLGRDEQYGYTTVGAHKADFKVLVDRKPAQDYLSRGQMKLLVIAMYLAQIKLMSEQSTKSICVLLDDLAAELDGDCFRRVMLFLRELGVQVFVTTTNIELFLEFIEAKDTKVFHVKQGIMQIGES